MVWDNNYNRNESHVNNSRTNTTNNIDNSTKNSTTVYDSSTDASHNENNRLNYQGGNSSTTQNIAPELALNNLQSLQGANIINTGTGSIYITLAHYASAPIINNSDQRQQLTSNAHRHQTSRIAPVNQNHYSNPVEMSGATNSTEASLSGSSDATNAPNQRAESSLSLQVPLALNSPLSNPSATVNTPLSQPRYQLPQSGSHCSALRVPRLSEREHQADHWDDNLGLRRRVLARG